MRDYMDSWLTPPKRVTSPTWGPPPPCEQALLALQRRRNFQVSKRSALESLNNDDNDGNDNGKKAKRFDLQNNNLCTCIRLFGKFLNCLISRFS